MKKRIQSLPQPEKIRPWCIHSIAARLAKLREIRCAKARIWTQDLPALSWNCLAAPCRTNVIKYSMEVKENLMPATVNSTWWSLVLIKQSFYFFFLSMITEQMESKTLIFNPHTLHKKCFRLLYGLRPK